MFRVLVSWVEVGVCPASSDDFAASRKSWTAVAASRLGSAEEPRMLSPGGFAQGASMVEA